jgi:hypothetical protein
MVNSEFSILTPQIEPSQRVDAIVIQLTSATMQRQCMARPGIEPPTLGKRAKKKKKKKKKKKIYRFLRAFYAIKFQQFQQTSKKNFFGPLLLI